MRSRRHEWSEGHVGWCTGARFLPLGLIPTERETIENRIGFRTDHGSENSQGFPARRAWLVVALPQRLQRWRRYSAHRRCRTGNREFVARSNLPLVWCILLL
jgi:hypothetical protein